MGPVAAAARILALAEAMRALLVDRARAAVMGADARQSVVRNYGIESARQRWAEVYEALS